METRTPVTEFMPRLRGTALWARVPFAELGPWPRGTANEARVPFVEIVPWLRGTALATLVPFTGTAVRICNRRRRHPWARNRGNLCRVIGQAGNRYASILRNKRRCPRQCCRRTGRVCRTAVELSFAGAEGTWLARVRVSDRVVGSSKTHSGSSSGSRRGRRVCITRCESGKLLHVIGHKV